MANFFTDLFESVTGQQVTPQQNIIPTADLYGQAYATATGLAPQVTALNQALAPGLADIQLGVERQIYGPQAGQLRQGTYQSILDQLNLGESLSPELTADITRKLFESGAATGFGASPAGRGGVILQTGLEGERRGQQRRAAALEATGMLPTSRFTAPIVGLPNVGELAGDIARVKSAETEYANLSEDIRRQNFTSLVSTGTRILGGVAGGIAGYYTGNVAGGVSAGQEIGGSLIKGSRVAGQQQQQQQQRGGMDYGAMLSGLAGMFGGGGGGGGYGGAGYGSVGATGGAFGPGTGMAAGRSM